MRYCGLWFCTVFTHFQCHLSSALSPSRAAKSLPPSHPLKITNLYTLAELLRKQSADAPQTTTFDKMAEPPAAEVLTFPTDPAQFDSDDRISFSRLDNKYIAVQESDGTEFEFDAQLRRWLPVMDDEEIALIQQQQSAYGNDSAAPPNDIAQSSGTAATASHSGNSRKRKQNQREVSFAHRTQLGYLPHGVFVLHGAASRFCVNFDGCCYFPCSRGRLRTHFMRRLSLLRKKGPRWRELTVAIATERIRETKNKSVTH